MCVCVCVSGRVTDEEGEVVRRGEERHKDRQSERESKGERLAI